MQSYVAVRTLKEKGSWPKERDERDERERERERESV